MTSDHSGSGEGSSRRKVLECMTWAGTGVLWTVSGGVPKSLSLLGCAEAAAAATQVLCSNVREKVFDILHGWNRAGVSFWMSGGRSGARDPGIEDLTAKDRMPGAVGWTL